MEVSHADIAGLNVADGQDSFEQMFRTWYRPLCVYARGFLGSSDEAEEVVQSVFIQLWEKRAELVIESSAKSYLYRAVRNGTLNKLKHARVKNQYADFIARNETFVTSEDAIAGDELRKRIQSALAKLPEQCRVVFELSRFEELKYAEIANRLGISVKTVENQMGKALRIMREQLKDYLPLILFYFNDFL